MSDLHENPDRELKSMERLVENWKEDNSLDNLDRSESNRITALTRDIVRGSIIGTYIFADILVWQFSILIAIPILTPVFFWLSQKPARTLADQYSQKKLHIQVFKGRQQVYELMLQSQRALTARERNELIVQAKLLRNLQGPLIKGYLDKYPEYLDDFKQWEKDLEDMLCEARDDSEPVALPATSLTIQHSDREYSDVEGESPSELPLVK